MKFNFQPIFLKKLWVRVLIAAAACVVIAAFVVVWSPWRTQEPWTPPSGKPTTAKAPKSEKLRAVPSGLPATMEALKQEAADLAERTIKAFPRDPDSHALKGNSCYYSGRAADAVKSWEKCLELDPTRADVYDRISVVAWQQGRFEEVITACRQALKDKAITPHVHLRLARALIELGRTEESITAAKRAVALWPRAPDAHLVLGQAYIQSRQYARARDCFLRTIEISPGNFHAYYGLATASAKLGQPDKARQYQEQFHRVMTAEKANHTAWKLKQTALSDLSEQRAKTVDIYVGTARIYRKHGNMRQAERLRQRAETIKHNAVGPRGGEMTQ